MATKTKKKPSKASLRAWAEVLQNSRFYAQYWTRVQTCLATGEIHAEYYTEYLLPDLAGSERDLEEAISKWVQAGKRKP